MQVVVEDLTLGIPIGQCFGLLGMNGAGMCKLFTPPVSVLSSSPSLLVFDTCKFVLTFYSGKSTTLGVLSADIEPTAGEIYLNSFNLLTNPRLSHNILLLYILPPLPPPSLPSFLPFFLPLFLLPLIIY